MRHILNFLRPLVKANYRYPVTILLTAAVLAVVGGYFALQLRIDTDIANLLPPDNPHVVALDQLRETVGGETEMEVAIKSPDFEANKRFAEYLIRQSMELFDPVSNQPFFSRYEFRRETGLLQDYALYLATDEELEDLIWYLEDEIEAARLEANPFFVDFGFDDDDEETGVDIDRFRQAYDELIPPEFVTNADSTVITFRLYPTGSRSNLNFLRRMFAAYDTLVVNTDMASFHPEMDIRFGGRLQRHLAEVESITQDVFSSFSTGISSVILLVMFYFFIKKYINYRRGSSKTRRHTLLSHFIRMPVSVLVIGIPLILSLCYTFGLAWLYLGTLNTMTSVLFVILFGLGIDYGLHFYARYLEKRSAGEDVLNALLNTYDSTGSAIMASALTTAVALFVLVFADFRGFSEFGFISGTGIVFAFLAMMYIMPALITVFEHFGIILVNENQPENGFIQSEPKRYPYARSIFVAGIVIVALVLINTDKLAFEYEFGKLEPEFTEFLEYRRFTEITPTGRRNPAYILAETDEQVREILAEIRHRQVSNPETTILDVEALQERFPTSPEEEAHKLSQIALIRDLLQDPFIRDQQDEDLDRIRRASLVTEPLDINELPSFMRERFVTRDGEIGRFVMIYPAVGLSDGRNSIAFKNEIASVTTSDGNTFYAASTSIAAAEMLELMQRESPYMVIGTFLMIFILVGITFRSLRWTIIALIPLLVGLTWLFGIMMIFGIKLNFYNLVVLPAILGIGNDNGVHLASRYLEEGKQSMWRVLKSTGQHITIGSLTTMLGFAGLLFTLHPGLYSIGLLALIGIGMTLLSGLTFLPALIQFLEDRNWIRFYDEFKPENGKENSGSEPD